MRPGPGFRSAEEIDADEGRRILILWGDIADDEMDDLSPRDEAILEDMIAKHEANHA